MIRAVVFDLADVYFSSGWKERLKRRYRLTSAEAEKITKEYNACALSKPKSRRFWMSLAKKTGEKDWRRMRESMLDTFVPRRGMKALLRRLRTNGYELLYLSNSHIDVHPELQKKYRFKKDFKWGILSHTHEFYKPDIRIYRKLIAHSGISAKETVFIDDKPKNLAPARKLGMKAVLFKDARSLRRSLERLGVDVA
jgi:HAD superfamily hydrolase (TIGR01509 family)